MTDTSLFLLTVVALTFLLAGFVKGVTGMGLPTVAIGLLSLVMPPAQAAVLLVVPSLVTNVWQLAAGPSFRPLSRRLWPMMAGICLGTWAGIGFLTGDSDGRALAGLGLALALYAVMGLAKVRLSVPPGAERWASPMVGVLTGLITGATSVFVIPSVPYLQALNLQKEDLIQALGLSFTISTVALAIGLAGGGTLQLSLAVTSLMALAPALIGMSAGQWFRIRAKPEVFRLCFFLAMLALGVHLLLRALI